MKHMAMVLVLVAAGCGNDDASTKSTKKEVTTTPPAETKPTEPAPAPQPIRVEGGFATPESVVHDIDKDVYYVSNINGSPFATDGNGFISKVKPDGTLAELKWIDGLNAPKGMTVFLGTLWVADIDVVRRFDTTTGEAKGEIPIEGATFLNDLTQMAGVVYVSDSGIKEGFEGSGTDAVYAIDKDGKVTARVEDPGLNRPNGLFYADSLYMVTFGANELHVVLDGKTIKKAELPKGGLDGLVVLTEDQVLVSSWECQCVYAGPLEGPFEPAIEGVKAPADIGWDARRKRVLIPLFEDNAVMIYPAP